MMYYGTICYSRHTALNIRCSKLHSIQKEKAHSKHSLHEENSSLYFNEAVHKGNETIPTCLIISQPALLTAVQENK